MVAVKKSLEAAEQLKPVMPSVALAIDAYVGALAGARKLRNMREHDWEHMAGKGHRQKEFVQDTKDDDGNVRYRMDATSTRIGPDGYWIGGRHRVETAMECAEKLLSALPDHA